MRLALIILFGLVSSAHADDSWKVILPPMPVLAGGKPLDVERQGHAAPFVADLDEDGVPDLVVGEFHRGRVRVYKNHGTAANPRFETHEPILASGVRATIPAG